MQRPALGDCALAGLQTGFRFALHKITRTVQPEWFYLEPQSTAEVDVRALGLRPERNYHIATVPAGLWRDDLIACQRWRTVDAA